MPGKKPETHKEINFVIHSLDGFAQGVDKNSEVITFVKGALPDEEGQAFITRKAKGVQFAQLHDPSKLTKTSDLRMTPECEHFHNCPGCHYQHVSYEEELKFKKNYLQFLFKNHFSEDIQVVSSHERFHYRSRIQLHYNKKSNRLGLIDASTKKISEIPKCLLINKELQSKYDELYENWQKILPKNAPVKGHIELVNDHGQASVAVNENYAHKGFEQVHRELNGELKRIVRELASSSQSQYCLDLFGGSGNLSRELKQFETYVIDVFCNEDQLDSHQQYISQSLDLQPSNTLNINSPLMIIDPPRRGFQKISDWVQRFQPESMIYVSCNAQTLLRDVKNTNYKVKKLFLLDLFPATHHFETIALLESN